MKNSEQNLESKIIASRGRNHVGLFHERIAVNKKHKFNIEEEVFSEEWKSISKEFGLMLNRKVKSGLKERVVVATVIQWLGSNVGWSFLTRVLDKMNYRIIKNDELDRLVEAKMQQKFKNYRL